MKETLVSTQETPNDKQKRKTFVINETYYFKIWYNKLKEEDKLKFKELIKEKRIEFVLGGYVANDEATNAFIASMQANIATIDENIALFGSEKGKEIFGAEKAAEMLAHAQECKAAGKKFCDCSACSLVEEILTDKEY